MDGVTILNTIELTGVSAGAWVTLLGSGLVLCASMLFPPSTVSSNTENLIALLIVIDVIMLFGSMFVAVYQSENHKTGELQYEVTIDDTVSMTEFNKKYEIVEQRGDIFVVKERE